MDNADNAVLIILGVLFFVVVFLLADIVVSHQSNKRTRKFLKEQKNETTTN